MKVKIVPGKNDFKNIRIPSSKSVVHRYIIASFLSDSNIDFNGIDLSDDIIATLDCINNLKNNNLILDCRESGSTLRFLIPIISALNKKCILKGSKSLFKRPLSIYEEIFQKQNLKFIKHDGCLEIEGQLKSDDFIIRGDISSQFITGLLFALPLLNKKSTIKILEPFESKSYVNISIDILSKFGIKIKKNDDLNYEIEGNQKYKKTKFDIEGDYSQMAFFATLGQINSKVSISNLNIDTFQGDKKIIDIIKDLKGTIYYESDKFISEKSNLESTIIDLKDCPDLGPIVMAMCTQAKGISKIINTKRLRLKESDRIKAMEEELVKLGCSISSFENEVIVKGKTKIKANNILYGHNDHRIVMALVILSTISENEVYIDGFQAINKSYPNFLSDIKSLGINIKEV